MILITGAKGQLGTELLQEIGTDRALGVDQEDFDLGDPGAIDLLESRAPDLVIHTAAWTNVDGCEVDAERAYRVNAEGTRHVARACQRLSIPLVYLSTDYVFDGDRRAPYEEDSAPNPLNCYGKSKLRGGGHVRSLVAQHYIVRTAWLYGRRGGSFVRAILGKGQTGEALRVVDDQVGSPTWARDLAHAIGGLIQGAPYGTYHITNSASCTWHAFAERILEVAGLRGVSLEPISSAEFGRQARRPSYSVLAGTAWLRYAGLPLRSWREALDEALPEILSHS